MTVIDEWHGREACHLQAALRMSNDAFAVVSARPSDLIPPPHDSPGPPPERAQSLLRRRSATATAKTVFTRALAADSAAVQDQSQTGAQGIPVAIAIVLRGEEVLLVCRRSDDTESITWQFPAGVVKPGARPDVVAVRETLAETGVRCTVQCELGNRIHPVTGVLCDYLLCDYLAGEATNSDMVENADVVWTPHDKLTRFIPAERIFPPVLKALEERYGGH